MRVCWNWSPRGLNLSDGPGEGEREGEAERNRDGVERVGSVGKSCIHDVYDVT